MPHSISVPTQNHQQFVEITREVERYVASLGVSDGVCFVASPHTTAGITINENADPNVRRDMLHTLDKLVPVDDPAYRHAEGNSAAHVKASMMGFNCMVPIENGRLVLGRWQGIYFCEFDGPRSRNVHVTVIQSG